MSQAAPVTGPDEPGCHCGRSGCDLGPPPGAMVDGYLTWPERFELEEFYSPAILRRHLERKREAEVTRASGFIGLGAHLRGGTVTEYESRTPASREPRGR